MGVVASGVTEPASAGQHCSARVVGKIHGAVPLLPVVALALPVVPLYGPTQTWSVSVVEEFEIGRENSRSRLEVQSA
jgi:hypothetical protein